MARLLPLLLFFWPTLVAAQTFQGRVVDAGSGEPLPGAHVFVDGTNIGDVAGEDGSFSVPLPERRPLVIVISMVGFRLQTVAVQPATDLSEDRLIELAEDPIILGEFVVEAVQPRALRRLRGRVEDLLFSTTPAGSRCEFENPQVLEIQNRGGDLVVRSAEPVRILNPYLGYRITIHGFRLEGSQRFYDFTGRLQFEDLPAANERVTDSRLDRRERVYLGSRQHFLRALVDGSLPESGFDAELVQGPGVTNGAETISEVFGRAREGGLSVLFGDPDDLTRSMMFSGALMVTYARESPLPAYTSFLRSVNMRPTNSRARVSWLTLPTGVALLDRHGVPFSDRGAPPISHYGYWSWERICDTLPADWTPPRADEG